MININKLRESYRKDGYIHVKSFFDFQAIEDAKNESLSIFNEYNKMDVDSIKFSKVKTNNGFEIYRIDPIQDISLKVRQLIKQESLAIFLMELFEEKIVLLKDKIIYKPAGSRGFPLHQDYSWSAGKFPRSLFTVLIALEIANKENGAVEFYKGYHHKLLSDETQARHFNEQETLLVSESDRHLIELEAGDIVVFSGLTPHRSEPNNSFEKTRIQVYLSYNFESDGNHYDRFLNHFREYSKLKRDENGEYIQ